MSDKEERGLEEERDEGRQVRCEVDRKRIGVEKTVRKLVEGTGREGR